MGRQATAQAAGEAVIDSLRARWRQRMKAVLDRVEAELDCDIKHQFDGEDLHSRISEKPAYEAGAE
jgi:hypothetical protein